MLHKCPDCSTLFLISDFGQICNQCGEYLRRRIEQLHEVDDAVEWWRWCSRMMNGEQVEREARWRIG